MKKTYLYAVALLAAILPSCRESLVKNLGELPFEEKLAVYCLLSPGDSVYAAARLAYPVSGNGYNDTLGLEGVSVMLFNAAGDSIDLPPAGRSGLYGASQKGFQIKEGGFYRLKAAYRNHKLKAVCGVPAKKAFPDSIVFHPAPMTDYPNREIMRVYWHSLGAGADYFHTEGSGFRLQSGLSVPWHSRNLSYDISQRNGLFSYEEQSWNTWQNSPYTFDFGLITLNRDLYLFYEQAKRMESSIGAGKNVFEAYKGVIPEHTNMEGGLGVFGAYLKHTTKITR